MKAYQLHDYHTEEILGTVTIVKEEIEIVSGDEELRDGWEDFNKIEEHDFNRESVTDFVPWFNLMYVTQIEEVEMDFIQPE